MNDRSMRPGRVSSPLLGVLLGAPFPLALGAMLSDWAYSSSFQVQWINFADWLVAGSLTFAGLALLFVLVRNTIGRRWHSRPDRIAFIRLVLFVIVQLINSLVHSKDAYATMPTGLFLSVVATLIGLAAAWSEFSSFRVGDSR